MSKQNAKAAQIPTYRASHRYARLTARKARYIMDMVRQVYSLRHFWLMGKW